MAAFGKPRDVTGKMGTFQSTLVPMDLLGLITSPTGIPIAVSGTSQRTFTVNASVSNPVLYWDGRDFVSLRESKSHDMGTGSTNSVLATTGALATSQTPGAVGMKYYYLGMDTTGALTLAPSTVAPSYVEGPFPGTILGHPGTTRDRVWRYMGFSFMSATTPVFDYFVKSGKYYGFSNHAYAGVDTQPGLITMAVVPAIAGIKISGYCTGAATGQAVELGMATHNVTTNGVVGAWKGQTMGATAPAGTTAVSPNPYPSFTDLPIAISGTSAGLVAHIEATATTVNIHVTSISDVV